MLDFTLKAYEAYLRTISSSYAKIITFCEYFKQKEVPDDFCIIRHDVDRFPWRALQMAQIEFKMGIASTYYFRSKWHTFRPEILLKIHRLGHEIGYHYECLSDTFGVMEKAFKNFEYHLLKFRQIVPVSTISMHGRPFSSYDNRNMWRNPEHHRTLSERYEISGEAYIDIDYNDILYITDTGRNWKTEASNRRDRVVSEVQIDFSGGKELLNYLAGQPHSKLIFQAHPERWTKHAPSYALQLIMDRAINATKKLRCLKK